MRNPRGSSVSQTLSKIKVLLSSIIAESQEEMIENSNRDIINLLNNRFDNLESKMEEGFNRLESKFEIARMDTQVSIYTLLHFEKEEIDNQLKKEDVIKQSNLEKKIKQIGIKGEQEESYLIDLATETRCCYLIQMEKLKLENLINQYGNMRVLERKVREACITAVQDIESSEKFNSFQFWKQFKFTLRDLAKNYGDLKSIKIDDEIVFAQMYQLAAECPLRWNKVG